jgi:hypothetical protein
MGKLFWKPLVSLSAYIGASQKSAKNIWLDVEEHIMMFICIRYIGYTNRYHFGENHTKYVR